MTMISSITQILAPDYCCSCQKIGQILCLSCRDDIISEPFGCCLTCLRPTVSSGLCSDCRGTVADAWVVGERTGVLEVIVNDSKFASNRRACSVQAGLLHEILPRLPVNTIIVPVPTIARHIRQRGYGHMERIARELARRRGLRTMPLLRRTGNTVQYGADRQTRHRQARQAFAAKHSVQFECPILLIDDVYTTGATMRAGVSLLRALTTGPIYIAVTTYQPLD